MIGELAAALDSERAQARTEIERLRQIIGTLQRDRFGRRSERLHDAQLQLGLEDLDADIARVEAKLTPPAAGRQREASAPTDERRSLADHLPRDDVSLDIALAVCPGCGGAVHKIGETVSVRSGRVTMTFQSSSSTGEPLPRMTNPFTGQMWPGLRARAEAP